MTKQKIGSPHAPKAVGPYSQAVEAGGYVFLSGQIPVGPDGTLLQGSVEEQVRQIMANLQAVLEAADLSFADVVKTTIYLTDMADFGKVNPVYGSYFSEPFPARETVCVKALPLGAQVEISMIAAIRKT
ncbi:RidA family protein [Candidatus Micrarchaeota archaeon]|nr:RidA family protein [Candidatus Micrarchaeota archaeon]